MLLVPQLDIPETAKVPGPVNICVLKFPQVTTAFPPVAVTKLRPLSLEVES